MKRFTIIPVLTALLLLNCQGLWAQATLSLHGSVMLKGVIEQNQADITAKSGLKLELVSNGSDNGLLDVAEKRADIAMVTAPVEDVARKINLSKPGAINLTQLRVIPLGNLKVVLIVNPLNPVRNLSDEQAAGLLTGKLTNWKEVGGRDASVLVFIPPPANALSIIAENQLLKGQKFSSDAKVMISSLQVRAAVAQSERALGLLGAVSMSDKVVPLTLSSSMVAPAAFVAREDASPNVNRLADAVRLYVQ